MCVTHYFSRDLYLIRFSIKLLLEVVNHSIVHSIPPPHPLQPPSMVAQHIAMANNIMNLHNNNSHSTILFQSSLSTNPHLLYNLIHSKDYFIQLLPYSHLFENNLISLKNELK